MVADTDDIVLQVLFQKTERGTTPAEEAMLVIAEFIGESKHDLNGVAEVLARFKAGERELGLEDPLMYIAASAHVVWCLGFQAGYEYREKHTEEVSGHQET